MGRMKDYYMTFHDAHYNGEFMTEESFIENFDVFEAIVSTGDMVMWNSKTGRLEEVGTSIIEVLNDIYITDPSLYKWADPENLSEELTVFLKLKGVM
jgi:hypothetical protein